MKQIQIISIGVLTYFLLGLFNWIQNGMFLFSFPLVPILILIAFVSSLIADKPKKSLTIVQIGLFSVLHAVFSYFILEIFLSFEQQMIWAQKGIIAIGQLVAFLVLVICAHTHAMKRGNRPLNFGLGMLFAGAVFMYLTYPTLPVQQAVLSGVGLIGAIFGFFSKNKAFDFTGLMLLIIGVLYLLSSLNWILY